MEEQILQEEAVEQPSEEASNSPTESSPEASANDTAPQEVENRNAQNIRVLREDKEKAQRANDELVRRLQAYEAQKQEADKKAAELAQREPTLAPDDLVEWRVVQKEIKILRDQVQQYQAHQNASAAEIKIRSQFKDFDSVVSTENIESLRTMEPELAASIHSNPDGYSKAVAAYKAIKKLGLTDKHALEREKIAQNAIRPRSAQSASPQQSDSPLTKANAYGTKLDKASKDAIWAEMQRITGRSY